MTNDELIAQADKAYYLEDEQIMPDEEYDLLRQQVGDPEEVPDIVSADFTPFTHPTPVLSLNKIYEDDPDCREKLNRWIGPEYVFQPKLDGLTIVAYPTDSGMIFVTRGSKGIKGEILPHFPTLKNVKPVDFPIRGEAILTYADFQSIVQDQGRRGERPFTSIRNAAAGILRRKDKSSYLDCIKFIAYDIPGSDISYDEKREKILNAKYPFVKTLNTTSLEKLTATFKDWQEQRIIPIDGVVLKDRRAGSLADRGVTGHHPNNMIAYKSTPDQYEVILKSVTWQPGRTKITPVAEFDSVQVGDAMVSRATLHNLGYVRRFNLHEGDTLIICRSGEVIPKVIGVKHTDPGALPVTVPDTCPVCNAPTSVKANSKREDVAELVCTNHYCRAKLAKNIEFLASKDVLDVEGIAVNTSQAIVDKYATDGSTEYMIFDLTENELTDLFGKALGSKIFKNIQASRIVTFPKFIKALCVPGIGDNIGDLLEQQFGTLSMLQEAIRNDYDFTTIDGIGANANTIIKSDLFLKQLTLAAKELTIKEVTVKTGALFGTQWALSGTFPIPKSQITNILVSLGAKVTNKVSGPTTHVLIADPNSNSNKKRDAIEKNKPIIGWDDFVRLTGYDS